MLFGCESRRSTTKRRGGGTCSPTWSRSSTEASWIGWTSSWTPPTWGHGFAEDREALRAFLSWQATTAPDWRIAVRQSAAEGELVAVDAHASGTRAEESPGVPYPSPQRKAFDWMTIYRLADGRIAEAWVVSREVPPEG